ncbi:2-oxo-4-hydroxy-4-carboxy-5-ureidoimidazoline decarboxylase [Streptomyces sp. MUM 178J]|uniref:2-oxo-4-hydroxy-4-carboxy-5-ureidoimidazoline decarboxylase n=1 Tax=Streptomyces sp. MUM 178J TaxID=2791991 RepID=UPI003FA79B78
MYSEAHEGPPKRPPTIPGRRCAEAGLRLFNAAAAEETEELLLYCCGSLRWARRVAAHRPYPDLDALLAAADEASYDLSPADVADALACESSAGLHPGAPPAAHTALAAAHAAYESRFGHAFVICLDGHAPDEHLNLLLTGIRQRLANDPDAERAEAAEELRGLARCRLAYELTHPEPTAPADSPSVAV